MIVAVGVGAFFFWPEKEVPMPVANVVRSPPNTVVTVAAPARLAIHAFPWGEVVAIRDTTSGDEVELAVPIVTPGSIELDAGTYEVTLRNPDSSDDLVQSIDLKAGELSVVFFQVRTDPGYPDFGGPL